MGYFIPTADDSNIEHFTTWAPYLAAKGIKGSFGLILGNHDAGSKAGTIALTWPMAKSMQDDLGQEMCFHALTQTTHDSTTLKQDATAYEASVVQGKRLMTARGLTSGHDICIDPPSAPNWGDATYGAIIGDVLGRSFVARRTAVGGLTTDPQETLPVANPQAVKAALYQTTTTVAQWRTVISAVRSNPRAVLVGVFHGNSAAYGSLQCTDANFKAIIDEVAFQRDNGYQSDLAANTAAGQLKTATLGQLVRGQLLPTA